jgi:hypothetical protein
MEAKKKRSQCLYGSKKCRFVLFILKEGGENRKENATLCTLKVQNSFLTNNSGT